jgi:hypothetical protein
VPSSDGRGQFSPAKKSPEKIGLHRLLQELQRAHAVDHAGQVRHARLVRSRREISTLGHQCLQRRRGLSGPRTVYERLHLRDGLGESLQARELLTTLHHL